MDSATHIMVPIIAYVLLPLPQNGWLVVIAALLGSLPDLDVFLKPLQDRFHSYYLSHRGGSHSLVIGIPLALVLGGLFSLFLPFNFGFLTLFCYGFYLLHLSLDLLTMSSIPLFYPLSKREIKFKVERSVNVYLMGFSGVVFIVFLVLALIDLNFFTFRAFYYAVAGCYALYFVHRIVYKLLFGAGLAPTEKYIPDLFPASFGIYRKREENSHTTYSIRHTSHLFKNVLPNLSQTINYSSPDSDIVSKAFANAQNFRFFHKWDAVIPFVIHDAPKERVTVILTLCESFSPKFAYFYQGIFDTDTRDLIEEKEGFDLQAAIYTDDRSHST